MSKDNSENISKFLNIYEQTELSYVRLDKYINKNKKDFTSQKLLLVISARGLKHFTHDMSQKRNLLKVCKVKESHNSPGVAQRVPGGLGSQIFMTFGTCRWWGRQSHAPAAFTSRNDLGTHFH